MTILMETAPAPEVRELPHVKSSWNGFDTTLRRITMVGAAILVWGTIALSIFGAATVASMIHQLNNQVNTTTSWNTDQYPDPSYTSEGGPN